MHLCTPCRLRIATQVSYTHLVWDILIYDFTAPSTHRSTTQGKAKCPSVSPTKPRSGWRPDSFVPPGRFHNGSPSISPTTSANASSSSRGRDIRTSSSTPQFKTSQPTLVPSRNLQPTADDVSRTPFIYKYSRLASCVSRTEPTVPDSDSRSIGDTSSARTHCTSGRDTCGPHATTATQKMLDITTHQDLWDGMQTGERILPSILQRPTEADFVPTYHMEDSVQKLLL